MNASPRLWTRLDLDTAHALDTAARAATQHRPTRTGTATIAMQCLNTLRGDLCDGTLAPADVDWHACAGSIPGGGYMLFATDPEGDLDVLADVLGADSGDRAFVNGIMRWAVERYLPEIRAAVTAKAA